MHATSIPLETFFWVATIWFQMTRNSDMEHLPMDASPALRFCYNTFSAAALDIFDRFQRLVVGDDGAHTVQHSKYVGACFEARQAQ